jgi:hypothetical protein
LQPYFGQAEVAGLTDAMAYHLGLLGFYIWAMLAVFRFKCRCFLLLPTFLEVAFIRMHWNAAIAFFVGKALAF